jgi:hypothetical protein
MSVSSAVPIGGVVQPKSGDTFSPSAVYFGGILLLFLNALLVNDHGSGLDRRGAVAWAAGDLDPCAPPHPAPVTPSRMAPEARTARRTLEIAGAHMLALLVCALAIGYTSRRTL